MANTSRATNDPLIYRAPLQNRIAPALVATPLYWLAIFGKAHLDRTSPAWLWLAAASGFLILLVGNLSMGFCTVKLYSDRVEKTSLFGKKVMKRSDVGHLKKRGLGLSILTYKYNSGDGMILPRGVGGDAAWNAWMGGPEKMQPP